MVITVDRELNEVEQMDVLLGDIKEQLGMMLSHLGSTEKLKWKG